jgi:hypothetical protein
MGRIGEDPRLPVRSSKTLRKLLGAPGRNHVLVRLMLDTLAPADVRQVSRLMRDAVPADR